MSTVSVPLLFIWTNLLHFFVPRVALVRRQRFISLLSSEWRSIVCHTHFHLSRYRRLVLCLKSTYFLTVKKCAASTFMLKMTPRCRTTVGALHTWSCWFHGSCSYALGALDTGNILFGCTMARLYSCILLEDGDVLRPDRKPHVPCYHVLEPVSRALAPTPTAANGFFFHYGVGIPPRLFPVHPHLATWKRLPF